MEQQTEKKPLAAKLLQLNLVAGALLLSSLMFAILGTVLVNDFPANKQGNIAEILVSIALVNLVLAQVLYRIIFQPKPDPSGQLEEDQVINSLFTATIIAFAVIESAALMGFLSSYFSGQTLWCQILGAAAFLSMLSLWPRASRVQERLPRMLL